jgi:hypothetical protein
MRAALADKIFTILRRHRASGDPARAQRAKRQQLALTYGAGLRRLHEIARLTPHQGQFLDAVNHGLFYSAGTRLLMHGGRQQGKSLALRELQKFRRQTDSAPQGQKTK